MLAIVYWISSSRGTAEVEHGFAKRLDVGFLGKSVRISCFHSGVFIRYVAGNGTSAS